MLIGITLTLKIIINFLYCIFLRKCILKIDIKASEIKQRVMNIYGYLILDNNYTRVKTPIKLVLKQCVVNFISSANEKA